MGEIKEFRVSSLSSAAEQRRLFAMHFVYRSSGNSSRWKTKMGIDRRKEEEEKGEVESKRCTHDYDRGWRYERTQDLRHGM